MIKGFKVIKPTPVIQPTVYERFFESDELTNILKVYLKQNGVDVPENGDWKVAIVNERARDENRKFVILIGETYEK